MLSSPDDCQNVYTPEACHWSTLMEAYQETILQLARKVWLYNLISAKEHRDWESFQVGPDSKSMIKSNGETAVWKSLLCRKVGTMWAVEDFSFSTCPRTISEVFLYCAFLKLDCYMRINFSTNVGSARCEGKVDWSCSVLRAKPWQETPHFSKLAQRFRGGEVRNIYDYEGCYFH